jgi:hypothetical protein
MLKRKQSKIPSNAQIGRVKAEKMIGARQAMPLLKN